MTFLNLDIHIRKNRKKAFSVKFIAKKEINYLCLTLTQSDWQKTLKIFRPLLALKP